MHAMRGISAHSNGFQTCRALHLLQLLLGAVDAPGSFRYQPPFPRPIPPANRPGQDPHGRTAALDAPPLGFVHGPEDLLVDADGPTALRVDHAYSWRYPLAVHGMMHTVIRNAWAGDPQPVDVLMLFMANMSWNSAMNTSETMRWLTDKDDARRVPHPDDHLFRRLFQRDGAPTPTWCCPTRPISNASTRSACSIARFPTPTAPPTPSAIRC